MQIRIPDGPLLAIPDELAAMILADPMSGDAQLPEFTLEEINGLVHWAMGTFSEPELTWDEIIQKTIRIYSELPGWNAEHLKKALEMVQHYNRTIKEEDIGRVDMALFFGTGKQDENVIENEEPAKALRLRGQDEGWRMPRLS